jgi:hypothetical protein
MFLSQAYARKLWTSHERKSAQARAFLESEEYILSIRLDDTDIPGIRPTVAYLAFAEHSVTQIADIIVKKLDMLPHGMAINKEIDEVRGAAEVRFRTTLDPDLDHLMQTAMPFLRWKGSALLSTMPVTIEWPQTVKDLIDRHIDLIRTNNWPRGVSAEAREQVAGLYANELSSPHSTRLAAGVRICFAIIRVLAEDHYANAGLSESEIKQLLSMYIASEMAAHVLQIVSFRLIGIEYPEWMKAFYGLESNYGCSFLPGLVLCAKNLAVESVLWVDTNFGEDSRITKYLYAPSSILIQHEHPLQSRDNLLKIIVPQLVAMVAEERLDWNIPSSLLKYPSNYHIRARGECFMDPETLAQPQHQNSMWKIRLHDWCSAKIKEKAYGELGLSTSRSRKSQSHEAMLRWAEWHALSSVGLGIGDD